MMVHFDYNQYTDDELLVKLGEGKQQALITLYNRYWDRLFVAAGNLLDSAEEAEECVQNVFIGLWQRREILQLTHKLSTYLATAVKYQAITALARMKREREHLSASENLPVSTETTSPESMLFVKELKQRIEAHINRLPPQCQLVFRMSREQDKPVKAIARELGLSENTVKMHLKNANRKLRGDLLALIFLFAYTPL